MILSTSKNVVPSESARFHVEHVTNFKLTNCMKHEANDNADYGTLSIQPKSELEKYMENLSCSEAKYSDGTEAKYIVSLISQLVEDICKKLRNKHKMFEQCDFLQTGSIFEELKVDSPDEFDFMIVLPYFANEEKVVFEAEEFQFLEWRFVDDEDCSKIETFQNIGNILGEIMATIALPDRWTRSTKHFGKYSTIQIAHTFQLNYNSDTFGELNIDVDLCFAVPLNKIAVWHGYYGYKRNSFLYKTKRKIFYILFDEKCRVSFSYYEKLIINQFKVNSNPKKLLRLLKVIRSKYLSKYFDSNSRTMNSLVSTYWLKTMIYHAIFALPCPQCWENKRIDNLVLDQLKALQTRIKQGELNSFFIPNYNLIFNFTGIKKTPSYLYKGVVSDEYFRKRGQLSHELDNLVTHLTLLRNGKMSVYQDLKELEDSLRTVNEKQRERGFKDELLVFLFTYAYNGADDKMAIETIKKFVGEFLPKLEIVGEGYDVVLKENGSIVDIDQWLTDVYKSDDDGKPFTYFPLSRK